MLCGVIFSFGLSKNKFVNLGVTMEKDFQFGFLKFETLRNQQV
jgi:hypothetical protein